MRNTVVLLLCLAVVSGCAKNEADRIASTKGRVPQDKALVIFGLAGPDVWGSGAVALKFDQFSLESGQITGNCSQYNRLEAKGPADDELKYYAFTAPPGAYVISPFHRAKVDASALLAFDAPAGVVSYLGDFYFEGSGGPYQARVIRRENLRRASEFAEHIGLPVAPVVAPAQPVTDRGKVFICTP